MSKKQDRIVYRKPDGRWANKRIKGQNVSTYHKTQRKAKDAARQTIRKEGGGELITKGLDGKIRSKDTIAPGRDPNPPKDTEH